MREHIKIFGMAIIALFVFVPALLSSAYYAQKQGVCLRAGRVLSEEELRKAVMVYLVNYRIKLIFRYNFERDQDMLLGINTSAKETDIRKLVETSYNNGKSLEENFDLTILVNGRKTKKYRTLNSKQLHEPFFILDFAPRINGDANIFFISSNVKEVAFSDLTPEQKEGAKEKITWGEKLLGYGNHYFDFGHFYLLERECCDNRNSDDKDYLDKKKEAYSRALLYTRDDDFSRGIVRIHAISNCGVPLLTKDGEIVSLTIKHDDEEP